MRKLIAGVLLIANAAHAQQWGAGVAMGNYCPSDYGPSRAGQRVNDTILNLNGRITELKKDIKAKKAQLKKVEKMIKADEKQLGQVLTGGAIDAIKYHYDYKHEPGAFKKTCTGDNPASAGSSSSNTRLPQHRGQANASGTAPNGTVDVPGAFCYYDPDSGAFLDEWQYYVLSDGRVRPEVCEDNFNGVHKGGASDTARSDCKFGLSHYYEDLDERADLVADIQELENSLSEARREKEREQYELDRYGDEEYTEGTYCADCDERGYHRTNVWDFLGQIAPIAILGTVSYFNNKAQVKAQKHAINTCARLGYPHFMCAGGGGGFGPGGNRHLANPYAGGIPGYFGAYNGRYGGVPGGMGPGAFNCGGNGWNPYMMGQMSPGMHPYAQGGPFANPHLVNPYMNGMNQGGGPWGNPFDALNPGMFQPFYGMDPYQYAMMNGGPNMLPYPSPYGTPGFNPYGNPMGQPGWMDQYPYMGGPPILPPWMNGGQNGYPYGPYGPYGPGGGGGWPYGPGGGGGWPYGPGGGGGWPYGPGGGGGNMSMIIGSLSYDLSMMSMKIRALQSSMGGYYMGGGGGYGGGGYGGGGYGGGYYGGGGAPPVLPFPGPNIGTGYQPYYGGYYTNPAGPVGGGAGAPAFPGAPSVPTR